MLLSDAGSAVEIVLTRCWKKVVLLDLRLGSLNHICWRHWIESQLEERLTWIGLVLARPRSLLT